MLGLLAPLAIKAAKFIGIHALPHIPIINRIPGVSALASLSGGGISNSSGALNILGNRMIIGFCLAGALFNHKFRRGMTLCIEAVTDALGSLVGAGADLIKALFSSIF